MRGPRRLTLKEAKLRGPQAVRDHRRNHGTAPSAADLTSGELGAPPAFLDAAGKAAWRRIGATVPAGLLSTLDRDLVAGLAAAIARHERAVVMSQNAWKQDGIVPGVDPTLFFNIERHVHRTARQVADLATALRLSPPARSRLALPVPSAPDEYDDNPVLRRLRLVTPGARHGAA
jgi:P27 family predicted phage terminase small subunit